MKKNLIIILVAFSIIVFLSGCRFGWKEFFGRNNAVNSRSQKIIDIAAPATVSGLSEYTCLIVADIHFGATGDDKTAAFFSWIDSLREKPKFCIVLGDMAEHGFENEFQSYADFQKKLNDRGIPCYGIVGNHDLYNSGYANWEKYVYPHKPYYRFMTSSFSWYFTDTGNGTMGKPQITNFLNQVENDGRPKVVCSHYPVYRNDVFYFALADTTERALLLSAFAVNNVKIVLTGHYHPGGSFDYGSFIEYGTKGFHDFSSCTLMYVNEISQTVSCQEKAF